MNISDDKINMQVLLNANNPGGLRVISSGWLSVRVYAFSRQIYNTVCANQSHRGLNSPCVYILWASGGKTPKPQVYVGESDTLQQRMVQHDQSKPFWERAAVYADTGGNLNKTQTRYIEAHLIRLAKEAGLCELENVNAPRPRELGEGDEHDAKVHLKLLCHCFLPLAGCDFFNPANRPLLQEPPSQARSRKDEQIIAPPEISVHAPVKPPFQIIREHEIDVNLSDLANGGTIFRKMRIGVVLVAVLNNENLTIPGSDAIATPDSLWHALANFGIVAPLDQSKGSGHRGPRTGPEDGFVWIEAASANIKQLFKKECGYTNYQPQLTANGGVLLDGQRSRRNSKRRLYYVNVPIAKLCSHAIMQKVHDSIWKVLHGHQVANDR